MPACVIPSSLQKHCADALEQYYQIAETKLKQTFVRPVLSFRQRGKIAGSARLQLNEIRLNPILLQENRTHFIHQVLPHEICHLLAFQLYGPVKPHGKEWRDLMHFLYALPATVTHNLDVSSVTPRGYSYQCQCGPVQLSLRRHNKVIRGQQQYLCRRCGVRLTPMP